MGFLVLTGCTTRLAYNLADWWISWEVHGYVTLADDQQLQLKEDIKTLHDWHRRTQLPRYMEFLQDLSQQLAKEHITAEQVRSRAIEIQQLLHPSFTKAKRPLIRLLDSLSSQQTHELLANLHQRLEVYQQDFVKPSEKKLRKKRLKSTLKLFESWVGDLSDEQKATLKTWNANAQLTGPIVANQRLTQNRLLLKALAHTGQKRFEKISAFVDAWLFHPEQHLREHDLKTEIHNQKLTFALIADLNNSLTLKQRKKRDAKIQKLIDNIARLIENP